MTTEQHTAILRDLAKKNRGIIHAQTAEANGMSRAMLSKLCGKGVISRIAVGQYVLSTELADELFSLCLRSRLITFSHETALFLNGISERTPFIHSVTISSSKKLGAAIAGECKVYYVKDGLVNLGRTMLKTTYGNPVPAYDMERTICDMIRSRSRIAGETYLSSLKMYAANPNKNLAKLNEYTEAFRITAAVRKSLETLL